MVHEGARRDYGGQPQARLLAHDLDLSARVVERARALSGFLRGTDDETGLTFEVERDRK
jgi:hypothetical protein